jgi:hypothetical protein
MACFPLDVPAKRVSMFSRSTERKSAAVWFSCIVNGGKESNMRSFEKRLAELERGLHRDDPIILEMPDGSTGKLIVGPGDVIRDLLARSMREMAAGVGFSRDVDTIRRSIGGTERGGHLVELCRALLNSPQ